MIVSCRDDSPPHTKSACRRVGHSGDSVGKRRPSGTISKHVCGHDHGGGRGGNAESAGRCAAAHRQRYGRHGETGGVQRRIGITRSHACAGSSQAHQEEDGLAARPP